MPVKTRPASEPLINLINNLSGWNYGLRHP
jgi:hypothetical protein